ncbi:serine hydrolase domain-containing protein [Longispora fulva]|uniref:CubicO group peptidase (Beta-lactamase class C family) n=1 Tax=Longispora fulva TaxID=619741 RepID=A0A8J7GQW5_9ACTN|nr:serine hydrolase domain-containing protein [Longispora fulva]MBG6136468.1 CubicO group peptidase (beta-lactamase class C family) [Longispora fulva]
MESGHEEHPQASSGLPRRAVLGAAAGVAVAATGAAAGCSLFRSTPPRDDVDRLFGELDDKIEKEMQAHAIPGAAVGVWYKGREHVRGFGVTNVDNPEPVDGDTLFRIASTTKPFTGTAVMRLVDAGKLDLDATVRTYLPDFAVADPTVSAGVTLRELLNHASGWLGDYFQDFGRGEDALTRFVAGMARLPQLSSRGGLFAYNNSAIDVAGRVLEKVTGSTYEQAIENLLLDPLELHRTRFFTDELVGYRFAAPHKMVNGQAAFDPSMWYLPRSGDPDGGLISSARDQLTFARFHLGDGSAPNGTRILSPGMLREMRVVSGPGGTLAVELNGMGVTWALRPTDQRVPVVQHGGDVPGQHSGFFVVPDRDVAFTVLTNSESGTRLTSALCVDDWVLKRFAGISNLPATPRTLSASQLAPYEGRYVAQVIEGDGTLRDFHTRLTADKGRLRYRVLSPQDQPIDPGPGDTDALAFYRDDYVLTLDVDGTPRGSRADFIRGSTGQVVWFRLGGRLNRKLIA